MRNRGEFAQLLDRHRLGHSQRLCIGLHIDPAFQQIEGSLLLAEGRGKFIKPQWVEFDCFPLDESLGIACRRLHACENLDGSEFLQLRVDLARVLAAAASQLATRSGSAANRLLAVCVSDPVYGPWITTANHALKRFANRPTSLNFQV